MAAVTYYSLLQYRMEEQRLQANNHFKTGNLAAAVDLYLKASRLFDQYNKTPNAEALKESPDAAASADNAAAASSSAALPALASVASPAMIRSALLEELTKSVGNACTSLYKLGRFAECASVAKRQGIDRNPYFAKGHAFVGMSNINLIAPLVKTPELVAQLSAEEKIIATQRLREAVQRLFTAMLVLPAMAAQVKASLIEGLSYIKALQKDNTVGVENATTSDLIEVTKSTGGHGNGVITKRALPAGTLLARLSHPFSVAAYDGYHKHVCVGCGVPILAEAFKEEGSTAATENTTAATTASKANNKRGCDACKMVRYCSEACQNRYHVPRHLLHECSYMLKLRIMCENITERELDVPDEFAELATHTITTLSGLLVMKSSPLSFFDPTNRKRAEELKALADNANKAAADNDNANTTGTNATTAAEEQEETFVTKAYKIRKSVLGLESHSVEVAQSMHPTLPLLCEVFSIDTMGDRGAVSTLTAPPTSAVVNNDALPPLDEHLVATLIGIVRCNSMEIADPSGLGVAQGLFAIPGAYLNLFPAGTTATSGAAPMIAATHAVIPASSTAIPLSACHFNHSCDPNAAFDVKAQEIRTIAPIQQGQDVTISYIPQLYWPSILRTEGLAERFYFNCSCDRCSPYRRAAVAEARRKEAAAKGIDANAPKLSPTMELLSVTTNDVEVSAIYDKISAAEKPIAATERPGATRYYYNNMLGVCGGIRQRPVEEIIAAQTHTTTETEAADGTVTTTESSTPTPATAAAVSADKNPLCTEVAALAKQCSAHLEPWHYVLHDIHNTQTFLYSVLGDHGKALVSSLEELLTFEACVSAGLPAKADKLRNILACKEGLMSNYAAANNSTATAFDEAAFTQHIANTVFGAECVSGHKDVLAMMWANSDAILGTLLDIHNHVPAQ